MSVTEEIVKEAVGLDFTQQRELLMFVKYLKTKNRVTMIRISSSFLWIRPCGAWKMSRIFMTKRRLSENNLRGRHFFVQVPAHKPIYGQA